MKKGILIGAGALAICLAAGAAWAHSPGHRMQMMRHMVSARIERMEDGINATPQQRAVIEQAKDEVFEALQKKTGQHTRQQLMALVTADKFDANALYALADQRAQDVKEMAKIIVPELQRVHDVLTPQQRATLAVKLQQHSHDDEERGGFGGKE